MSVHDARVLLRAVRDGRELFADGRRVAAFTILVDALRTQADLEPISRESALAYIDALTLLIVVCRELRRTGLDRLDPNRIRD